MTDQPNILIIWGDDLGFSSLRTRVVGTSSRATTRRSLSSGSGAG